MMATISRAAASAVSEPCRSAASAPVNVVVESSSKGVARDTRATGVVLEAQQDPSVEIARICAVSTPFPVFLCNCTFSGQ